MPIIDNPLAIGPAADIDLTPEERPEGDGFIDSLGPAFRTEFTPASTYLHFEAQAALSGGRDEDYDVFADLGGYEEQAGQFVDAYSRADADIIKAKIDRERSDRERLQNAGMGGFFASLAAGIVDPINLVPVGGAVVRGGSLLRNGARTAFAGASGATASEAILQSTQFERTWGESATNIAGGALLGGILGGASSLLSRAQVDELGGRIAADLEGSAEAEIPLYRSGADMQSAGAMAADQGEYLLPDLIAKDTKAFTALSGPLGRMVRSPSRSARRAVNFLSDNFYGLKGQTSVRSVEIEMQMAKGLEYQGRQAVHEAFLKYRQSRSVSRTNLVDTVRKPDQMTYQQFKDEVSYALRRNEEHPIAEVAEAARAARARVFDPPKERAIANRLLDADVKPETAASYLTRVYNTDKIMARYDEWIGVVTEWLTRHGAESPAEAQQIATEITSKITSTDPSQLGSIRLNDLAIGVQGPLKERTFSIDDELIEGFLENDIEVLMKHYLRRMTFDNSMIERFGDVNGEDALAKIRNDYDGLLLKAKTDVERKKLSKRMREDLDDFIVMRDRLRGTYNPPKNAADLNYRRTMAQVRQLNYQRLLGGMALSSISDVAGIVSRHGFLRTFRDGTLGFVRGMSKIEVSAAAQEEIRGLGYALDQFNDSRMAHLADIGQTYGRESGFEKASNTLSEVFTKATGMNHLNAFMKQVSALTTSKRIADGVLKMGRLSERERKRLAFYGIDDAVAARIRRQMTAHAQQDRGGWVWNFEKWADQDAAAAIKTAIIREGNRSIVEIGQERPIFMSSELGKTLFQFKSFMISAHQRILLTNIAEFDRNTLQGLVGYVGLGMLSYAAYQWARGEQPSADPAVWVKEGVDRSGVLGYFLEINNMVEKGTRGRMGLGPLMGTKEIASRYQSRSLLENVLGPTFGTAGNAVRVVGAASAGDWNEGDTRAIRRLLPFQNLFYIRQLLDQVEVEANQAMGVPVRG